MTGEGGEKVRIAGGIIFLFDFIHLFLYNTSFKKMSFTLFYKIPGNAVE